MACREHLDLSVNNCRERAKPATRAALNNRAGKASRVRIQVRGATFFFCAALISAANMRLGRRRRDTTYSGDKSETSAEVVVGALVRRNRIVVAGALAGRAGCVSFGRPRR